MLRTPGPLLSIVIVSWNTRGELHECLTSIYECTPDLEFEIFVVENGSTDGSAAMLERDFPAVKVIRNKANVGFAKGCNQGMQVSRGPLILLLNSDTYVRDDVITRIVRYLLSRSEIAMAGCQLRFPDGRVQHSAFRALSIWRSLFEDLWLYKLLPKARRDEVLLGGYWQNDREIEVDWLAGAFMMLRREVFEQVGGFSENFFMYGEDSEWCMRIRRAGHRIFYNPLGVVYHIGSVSSDMKWTQKERLNLCHLGGLRAYSNVNGPILGIFYHFARLLGSLVRVLVYATVATLKPTDYYHEQRRVYRWQAEVYLRALWQSRKDRLRTNPV
jgi:GT2 family glycosyltransferase